MRPAKGRQLERGLLRSIRGQMHRGPGRRR
nr:MAG TPA: hypothetical protein [Caudoviricetes sp.]